MVDQADEQFLVIVHQLLLSHQVSSTPVNFTSSEQAMLLRRREEMISGKVKGIPFKNTIKRAKANLRKKK
ncbi:MAG: hypothetical protein FD123_3261 [Bacteroidetes bacterium]|nr:MAG: hypothetical protein FD123_3261 [Bacteroidota bacterium]